MVAAGRNLAAAEKPIPTVTVEVARGNDFILQCEPSSGWEEKHTYKWQVYFLLARGPLNVQCHDMNEGNGWLRIRNASSKTAGEYSCYEGGCCDWRNNPGGAAVKKYEVLLECESLLLSFFSAHMTTQLSMETGRNW